VAAARSAAAINASTLVRNASSDRLIRPSVLAYKQRVGAVGAPIAPATTSIPGSKSSNRATKHNRARGRAARPLEWVSVANVDSRWAVPAVLALRRLFQCDDERQRVRVVRGKRTR